MQCKTISKKDAYRVVNNAPGDLLLAFKYDCRNGISNSGKYIKKNQCKKLVNKSSQIILTYDNLVNILTFTPGYCKRWKFIVIMLRRIKRPILTALLNRSFICI